jgi:hypothetical protein
MEVRQSRLRGWQSSHPDKRKSLTAKSGGLYFFTAMKA